MACSHSVSLLFLCLVGMVSSADPPYATPALDLGTAGVATIPANAAYEFGTGDFTVEVWARVTKMGALGIVSSVFSTASGGCGWGIWPTDSNTVSWYLGGGGCTAQSVSVSGLQYDCWHHFAGVRETNGGVTTIKLFLDGIEAASANVPLLSIGGNKNIVLGRRFVDVGGFFFSGWVQELKVWNVKRSQAEIQGSMGQPTNVVGSLVGYWRVDEGTGTSLSDDSANSNAASLSGTYSWVAIGNVVPCGLQHVANYQLTSTSLGNWPQASVALQSLTATADDTVAFLFYQVSSPAANTYIVTDLLVNGASRTSTRSIFGSHNQGCNVAAYIAPLAKDATFTMQLRYRTAAAVTFAYGESHTVALSSVAIEGATLLYDSSGSSFTATGDDTFRYFSGLSSIPFTVTEDSLVLLYYHVSGSANGGYQVSRQILDGSERVDMRDIQGQDNYVGAQGITVLSMTAGSHTAGIQYRRNANGAQGTASDWRTAHMYGIQLPSNAQLLLYLNPTNNFVQPLSTFTTWNGLSGSFSLAAPTRVMIWYHINGRAVVNPGVGTVQSRLILDGVERSDARSVIGVLEHFNNQGLWTGVLSAGSHTVEAQGYCSGTNSADTWTPSNWRARSLFVLALPETALACTNGTVNDPTVALDSPVLASVAISGGSYEVSIDVDHRFNSVHVSFENSTPCDYDSTSPTVNTKWTSTPTANECTSRLTYSHNAQDTLASCGFTKSTQAINGYFEYTNTISVRTNQTRLITYQQGFRDQTYFQVKTTFFHVTVRVPESVTVSSSVDVYDSRTVLSAITQTQVTVGSPAYLVNFNLLVSTQHPYELTYSSISPSTDISAAAVSVNSPSCTIQPDNSCNQEFQFSNLAISTGCPDKSFLGDAFTVTFTVGCKASFSGNCVTPSPATADVSFTLNSTGYCPLVDNVTLSATMATYKDVDIDDVNAWDGSQVTNQFVVGATVYGLIDVTVGESAATTDTTVLRSLSTVTGEGQVAVVTAGTPLAGSGVVVQDGSSSIPLGSDNYRHQTRFAVPLSNGVTVALDPVADAAQVVVFTAVVDVTFTTAGVADHNALLQEWHPKQQSHSSVRLSSSSTRNTQVTATVSLVPTTTTAGSGGGSAASSSVVGVPATVAVVLGAALAVLVVVGAYFTGRRSPPPPTKEQDSHPTLRQSSSTAELRI